jgi:hypothetical protein
MSWASEEARAVAGLPWSFVCLIASALLLASLFAACSASAISPGKAAGGAGAVVEQVTETPSPSPPSPPTPPVRPVTPPTPPTRGVKATPPAPVRAPAASPQAPANPVKPVSPTGVRPPSSHGPPSPPGNVTKAASETKAASAGTAGAVPSVDALAGGPKDPTDPAASTKATPRSPAAARDGFEAGSHPRDRAAQPRESTTPWDGKRPVESARVVPVGRFVAYVWPAIALGLDGGLVATLFSSSLTGGNSLSVAEAARTFLRLAGGIQTGGESKPPHHPQTPSSSPSSRSSATHFDAATAAGLKTFLFAMMAAALVLAFTIWADSSTRFPGHRNRWPGGL